MKRSIKLLGLSLALGAVILASTAFRTAETKTVYTQITTIESVVPGGLGRSRMVTTDHEGNFKEQDMENFFSLVGINFGNVRKNDKLITDQINKMTSEGWSLSSVNSGVYGADKSTGIFITRYLFKKDM